jgi:hypothetical protein
VARRAAPKPAKRRRVSPRKRLPRQPAWAPPAEYSIEQVLALRWRELGYERVPVSAVEPACKELSRWDIPVTLPGTGMFSGYEELGGQITIVRLLRATPWLYRPLRDAVRAYFDNEGAERAKEDGRLLCLRVRGHGRVRRGGREAVVLGDDS